MPAERTESAARAERTELALSLRRAGVGDVDDTPLTRSLYATDASLYRVVPQVVARPRHVEEVEAALAVARETGVGLTMRGAGTSIAGNAVGPGIVLDTSRYLNRVLDLDPLGLWDVVRREGITMCGVLPMALGLFIAKALGAREAVMAAYATSGEVTGDMEQVVGYAGVIVR